VYHQSVPSVWEPLVVLATVQLFFMTLTWLALRNNWGWHK